MHNEQFITAAELFRLEPISMLSIEQIQDLATQTWIEQLPAGTLLFQEGDTDNRSVYILEGEVKLFSKSHPEAHIVKSGSEAARRTLAPGHPRRFSAITQTEARIIRIDSDLLDSMLTWSQFSNNDSEVVMSEEGVITIDKGAWLKKMYRSPTFKNLPPANLETLLDRMEPVRINAGDVIIRQGDVGDYFYMIHEGAALVTRQAGDEEEESIELAELTEGSSFGEAALISDRPRNATVSMMTDGVLLRLSKDDFNTLLKEPSLHWISYEAARAKIGEKVRWLDVRLGSEYRHAHLPNALNIPLPELHRRARDLDRNVLYICYCDTGRRGSAAAFILKQYNIDAEVLKGGLQGVSEDDLIKS